ncbi:MAG: hypothetical protein H6Q60_512 [Oscillospiraceae bacterium]|nr:hypothetical protein [Oscillospiraceae bacterium]
MKFKKAGMVTKIVIVTLFIFLTTTLLGLRSQVQQLKQEQEEAANQVEEQTRVNAELSDSIENSSDPERIQAIAREKLGLVEPGEIVFYDSDN